MLEVLFSDSEKGSMKVAKNYNVKNMLSGSVSYIGKKPTKAELEKHFEGMIEENKLIVIENNKPSHPYGKVLRKV